MYFPSRWMTLHVPQTECIHNKFMKWILKTNTHNVYFVEAWANIQKWLNTNTINTVLWEFITVVMTQSLHSWQVFSWSSAAQAPAKFILLFCFEAKKINDVYIFHLGIHVHAYVVLMFCVFYFIYPWPTCMSSSWEITCVMKQKTGPCCLHAKPVIVGVHACPWLFSVAL